MRCLNKMLPEFLGFNEAMIMFLDDEKEELYTITFGDDEEYNQALKKKRQEASN